jgi:iron complex transport system ATP-binding protein
MSVLSAWRRDSRAPGVTLPGAVALEAKGVSCSLGGVPILVDIDLPVRAGEVLCLVGPNGAGKSTLLSVLAGDRAPDSGAVTIEGAPVTEWSTTELAMRRAVLLQQVELSFAFTVAQVVEMGRAPWAGTDAEDLDEEIVAGAMVATDTTELATRKFSSLSGGERARAALARVLAQRTKVLLLDEPTAALDIRHQEHVLRVARQRAAEGDAVVVVMHSLDVAAAHADQIVVMSHGRIHAHGRPAEVLTAELLSAVYEHPIELVRHPRTGAVLILPRREELEEWR